MLQPSPDVDTLLEDLWQDLPPSQKEERHRHRQGSDDLLPTCDGQVTHARRPCSAPPAVFSRFWPRYRVR